MIRLLDFTWSSSSCFTLQEEDPLAGSLTGWKLMPRHLDKSCASRVAAGWIKEKMTGPSSGTYFLTRFRHSFTHRVCLQKSTTEHNTLCAGSDSIHFI